MCCFVRERPRRFTCSKENRTTNNKEGKGYEKGLEPFGDARFSGGQMNWDESARHPSPGIRFCLRDIPLCSGPHLRFRMSKPCIVSIQEARGSKNTFDKLAKVCSLPFVTITYVIANTNKPNIQKPNKYKMFPSFSPYTPPGLRLSTSPIPSPFALSPVSRTTHHAPHTTSPADTSATNS